MESYITGVIGHEAGPCYKHVFGSHGIVPTYPSKVRILSSKEEKGVTALRNRTEIERAINPFLISLSGHLAYSVNRDIINAVAEVMEK